MEHLGIQSGDLKGPQLRQFTILSKKVRAAHPEVHAAMRALHPRVSQEFGGRGVDADVVKVLAVTFERAQTEVYGL